MKGRILSLMAVFVLASLFYAGCAPAAATPTAAPKAAEPTKSAAPAAASTAAPTKAAAAPTAVAAPKVAFPEKGKAITLIIPFAAGGATDVGGRLLAGDLEKVLGTTVQIVNRVGASGQTGVSEMLQAKPDGYTLAEASVSTTVTQMTDPARQAPFKSRNDFTLVAGHHKNLHLLAVKADSPYKTLKDLVDAAKANPNRIRISDSGLLSAPHLIGLIFQKAAGVQFSFVHFSGGAESVPAMLGGHVEVLAGGVTDVLSLVKSGEVRVLGIADNQESQFLPGVPTMASQGYNVPAISGTGVMGPPGMPKEVVDVLSDGIKKALENEEQLKKMTELGFIVRYLSPADYIKVWDETEGLVAPIVKQILADQAQQKK